MNHVFLAALLILALLHDACMAQQQTHNVTVAELKFVPESIVIRQGECVAWTGLQAGFHNVAEVYSSESTTHNGGFRSGEPGSVDVYSKCFSNAGSYYYVCEPHASFGMRGVVVVMESNSSSLSANFSGVYSGDNITMYLSHFNFLLYGYAQDSEKQSTFVLSGYVTMAMSSPTISSQRFLLTGTYAWVPTNNSTQTYQWGIFTFTANSPDGTIEVLLGADFRTNVLTKKQ